MSKQGASAKEIGDVLGRPESSIARVRSRLIRDGKLNRQKQSWSDKDIQILIDNVKFDQNGYVNNHDELTKLTGKRQAQISSKLSRLRKQGVLNVTADRTKTSAKSKDAMNKFNEARFAQYGRGDKKVESQTVSVEDVTVSKVVQVILTTITINGVSIEHYFSMDGQLIAKQKATTPASK